MPLFGRRALFRRAGAAGLAAGLWGLFGREAEAMTDITLKPGENVLILATTGQTLSMARNTAKTKVRVTSSGTLAPDPTPVPTPTPTPPPLTPSGPVVATTNGQVIENLDITAPAGTAGVLVRGLSDVIVRNCHVTGSNVAISAESVTNLTVTGNVIDGAAYAGVLLYGVQTALVEGNTISRIGPQQAPKAGDPEVDAYGIATRGGLPAVDVTIRANTVTDVPVWQGINAHEGTRLLVENNVVKGCRRAYWIASNGRITDSIIRGNRADAPWTGTYDPTAYFMSNTDRCSVTGNWLSTAFPGPADGGEWLNFVRDYLNASTALVRSGNVRS